MGSRYIAAHAETRSISPRGLRSVAHDEHVILAKSVQDFD
jgi:hypothetical protein